MLSAGMGRYCCQLQMDGVWSERLQIGRLLIRHATFGFVSNSVRFLLFNLCRRNRFALAEDRVALLSHCATSLPGLSFK